MMDEDIKKLQMLESRATSDLLEELGMQCSFPPRGIEVYKGNNIP